MKKKIVAILLGAALAMPMIGAFDSADAAPRCASLKRKACIDRKTCVWMPGHRRNGKLVRRGVCKHK